MTQCLPFTLPPPVAAPNKLPPELAPARTEQVIILTVQCPIQSEAGWLITTKHRFFEKLAEVHCKLSCVCS